MTDRSEAARVREALRYDATVSNEEYGRLVEEAMEADYARALADARLAHFTESKIEASEAFAPGHIESIDRVTIWGRRADGSLATEAVYVSARNAPLGPPSHGEPATTANADNGHEPRYWIDNNTNEDYRLRVERVPDEQPLYGICDEEAGGYVAFVTDQEVGDQLVAMLNAHAEGVQS